MSTPIINPSSLTEEQREAIKAKYEAIIYLNQIGYQDKLDLLEWLFSKDFFKGENNE